MKKLDPYLPQRLRLIKARRNLTWRELAKLLGVTKSAIDKYLAGRNGALRRIYLRVAELETQGGAAETVERSLEQFRQELAKVRQFLEKSIT